MGRVVARVLDLVRKRRRDPLSELPWHCGHERANASLVVSPGGATARVVGLGDLGEEKETHVEIHRVSSERRKVWSEHRLHRQPLAQVEPARQRTSRAVCREVRQQEEHLGCRTGFWRLKPRPAKQDPDRLDDAKPSTLWPERPPDDRCMTAEFEQSVLRPSCKAEEPPDLRQKPVELVVAPASARLDRQPGLLLERNLIGTVTASGISLSDKVECDGEGRASRLCQHHGRRRSELNDSAARPDRVPDVDPWFRAPMS